MDGEVAWYVVVTAPRVEVETASRLAGLGVAVYLPMATRWMRIRRRKREAREKVRRPAFPRYLFIGVAGLAPWMAIKATDGVSAVLSHDHVPIRLAARDVDDVRVAEDMGVFDETVEPRRLKIGDRVVLTYGPMDGYEAVVVRPKTGGDAVEVEVDFLGRKTVAKVSVDRLKLGGDGA